jgi:hypothetical protein
MKHLLFILLIISTFSLFSQDKQYKDFDANKITIWQDVKDVNDYNKQQYVVETFDSLATVVDKNLSQVRIFFSRGMIRKMEVTFQNNEKYDFLWKYHTGTTIYDVQYYFYESKLYETKNSKKLMLESETNLIQKAAYFRNLGYQLLKG